MRPPLVGVVLLAHPRSRRTVAIMRRIVTLDQRMFTAPPARPEPARTRRLHDWLHALIGRRAR